MIESITVMNHLNDVLELTLRNPYQTGIVVKSITGLGPGKASINTVFYGRWYAVQLSQT